MIVLYILLGILLLFSVLLFMPVTLKADLGENNIFCVCFFGIKIYDSSKTKKDKPQGKKNGKSGKKPQKKQNGKLKEYFLKSRKEKGTLGAFKDAVGFVRVILNRILWILKRVKINILSVIITVASDNAATTAIEYGGICTAVYPVISFLDSNSDIKFKEVDIKADFNKEKFEYRVLAEIKLKIIYFILGAYCIIREIKKKEGH